MTLDSVSSTILVADDDRSTRMLLRMVLSKESFEIIEVENGVECLAAWEKHQPDMILLDAMMPIMDGFDCCSKIQQIQQQKYEFDIPILMITGLNDRESVDRAFAMGATDYITKPIHPPVLRQRLNRMLQAARAEKALKASEAKLIKQNLLLQSELNRAANYVQSLLPKPLKHKIQTEHYFAPSAQLGGDIFDYYWLDDNHLAIYLLDVAGHGVQSALLSLSVLNLLRAQSLYNTNFYEPWTVLRELNRSFQMNETGDNYFTIWYGVISLERQELTYASAGHPPSILVSNGEIKLLGDKNIPVGMLDSYCFEQQSHPIASGDRLYLLSDGVYEIFRTDGKIWGYDRLVQLIQEYQDRGDFPLSKIWQHVCSLHPQHTLEDDFSLLRVTL